MDKKETTTVSTWTRLRLQQWLGRLHIQDGDYYIVYRVTDEALIAETMVWPNFFLMNVFFALKGSKLYYYLRWLHGQE